MMLNCFGIDKYDKLHGFMMHSVILAVCRISCENDYSFVFQMLAAMRLYMCVRVKLI